MFSRKLNKTSYTKIVFNSVPTVCVDWQKHLGMYLDMVLNFKRCIKEKMSKAIKEIVAIYKLGKTLPRHSLITISKSMLRFHLDYGDIIYNQPNRGSFGKKIGSI